VKVDVRVIAATHQNLEERVERGIFREDLYHRLNVIRIELPPLRSRTEDVPDLLGHYLRQAAAATIVTVGSGAGLLPTGQGASAYAASKAGVMAMMKALAAELAPGIRANAVAPGIVHTPMVDFLFSGYDNPDDAPFVQQYAMKRVARPEELAQACLYLTSAESSFVTGTILSVDGGRTFH